MWHDPSLRAKLTLDTTTSFWTSVTWHTQKCDVTNFSLWHGSILCVPRRLTLISYRVAKMHRMPYVAGLAKEPMIMGLFCGKWPIKIRHPVHLRRPVPFSHIQSPMVCQYALFIFSRHIEFHDRHQIDCYYPILSSHTLTNIVVLRAHGILAPF